MLSIRDVPGISVGHATDARVDTDGELACATAYTELR